MFGYCHLWYLYLGVSVGSLLRPVESQNVTATVTNYSIETTQNLTTVPSGNPKEENSTIRSTTLPANVEDYRNNTVLPKPIHVNPNKEADNSVNKSPSSSFIVHHQEPQGESRPKTANLEASPKGLVLNGMLLPASRRFMKNYILSNSTASSNNTQESATSIRHPSSVLNTDDTHPNTRNFIGKESDSVRLNSTAKQNSTNINNVLEPNSLYTLENLVEEKNTSSPHNNNNNNVSNIPVAYKLTEKVTERSNVRIVEDNHIIPTFATIAEHMKMNANRSFSSTTTTSNAIGNGIGEIYPSTRNSSSDFSRNSTTNTPITTTDGDTMATTELVMSTFVPSTDSNDDTFTLMDEQEIMTMDTSTNTVTSHTTTDITYPPSEWPITTPPPPIGDFITTSQNLTEPLESKPYLMNRSHSLSDLKTDNITSRAVSNLTTRTDWNENHTDVTAESVPDEIAIGAHHEGIIVAIIIASVGGVCLAILIILLLIVRRRHTNFNFAQRCTPVSLDQYSIDNQYSVQNSFRRKDLGRGSKTSFGNPAFDDPDGISNELNFTELRRTYANTAELKQEYETIPQIRTRANELPDGCHVKNRYANIIPLPETRVVLTPIEGYPNSDYINANYVTGHMNVSKYYIACQAPIESTVDDFWRMIWEQQSKLVLMLTQLYENKVEKCYDYLPHSEVLDSQRTFGNFQVILKKRDVKSKYVISDLQLKDMVSNSWRNVTHMWYLAWPETGVPTDANHLIAFLLEARSHMKTNASDTSVSPVVVHCSPGTGRTGVVIACDIAIREFEQMRRVNIPQTVYKIRRCRANAVQTREQYIFIYKMIYLYASKLTEGVLDFIR